MPSGARRVVEGEAGQAQAQLVGGRDFQPGRIAAGQRYGMCSCGSVVQGQLPPEPPVFQQLGRSAVKRYLHLLVRGGQDGHRVGKTFRGGWGGGQEHVEALTQAALLQRASQVQVLVGGQVGGELALRLMQRAPDGDAVHLRGARLGGRPDGLAAARLPREGLQADVRGVHGRPPRVHQRLPQRRPRCSVGGHVADLLVAVGVLAHVHGLELGAAPDDRLGGNHVLVERVLQPYDQGERIAFLQGGTQVGVEFHRVVAGVGLAARLRAAHLRARGGVSLGGVQVDVDGVRRALVGGVERGGLQRLVTLGREDVGQVRRSSLAGGGRIGVFGARAGGHGQARAPAHGVELVVARVVVLRFQLQRGAVDGGMVLVGEPEVAALPPVRPPAVLHEPCAVVLGQLGFRPAEVRAAECVVPAHDQHGVVDGDFLARVHGLARDAFGEFGAVPMVAVRGDGYRDGALVVDDALDGVDAGLHGGAGDAVKRRGQVVGVLQVEVGGVAQALVHVRCLEGHPRRQHRPFPGGQRADGLLVPGAGVVSLLGVALRALHFLLLVAVIGEPG